MQANRIHSTVLRSACSTTTLPPPPNAATFLQRAARLAGLLAMVAAISSGSLTAQGPAVVFQATYGGTLTEQLTAIATTPDGGYLLGGYSDSPPSGNKTAPEWGGTGDWADYWVAKVDSAGVKQWDRSYGGWEPDFLRAILPTKDGGFLLGGESRSWGNDSIGGPKTAPLRGTSDFWIFKVDASGNRLWDQSYGGPDYQELRGMIATSDGGCLLGGWSLSPVGGNKSAPNLGDNDFWVVRIDVSGTKLWDKTYGGRGGDLLYAMAPTPDGGALLGGWSNSDVSGTKSAAGFGGLDFWVVKIDAEGNQQWDRTYGGAQDDSLQTIVPAADGGYLLAGKSSSLPSGNKTAPNRGMSDYWAVKVGADGTRQWDQSYGGTSNDSLFGAYATADGGFLLGGGSASPPGGNKTAPAYGAPDYFADAWIVKINARGDLEWDRSFGGSGADACKAFGLATDGGLILAGDSSSGTDGNKTAPNFGNADYWLLTIAAFVPPTLTEQPKSLVVASGMTVTLSVAAFSFTQPIGYQWRFDGVDIQRATNAVLTLTNVQPAQAGRYSVVVRNDYGTVESQPAMLTYSEAANVTLDLHPSLTIYGVVGTRYRVEYTDALDGTLQWNSLGELSLTNSPQLFVDTRAARLSQRIYRVLLVQ